MISCGELTHLRPTSGAPGLHRGSMWAAFLSSSVGSKQVQFWLVFSESHWNPYPKDTGP